jgi:hypothetical protein
MLASGGHQVAKPDVKRRLERADFFGQSGKAAAIQPGNDLKPYGHWLVKRVLKGA